LALQGAEIIFYPTAIGSEPPNPSWDSKDHWQVCMQGHSGANIVPVVTSNRVGKEAIDDSEITFYGSSFITNQFGAKIKEANRTDEAILIANFDLAEIAQQRVSWGLFRDRRPALYSPIMTLDGSSKQ